MIQVDDSFAIPEEELSFATSRSGGPGGQNVNKLETRVTVRFDLASPSLDEARRTRIRERLGTRVSRAGVLAVSSQRHRTQAANREAAVARLVELLRDAFAERAPRRPTRPGRAARARRLDAKLRRSRRKRDRSTPAMED